LVAAEDSAAAGLVVVVDSGAERAQVSSGGGGGGGDARGVMCCFKCGKPDHFVSKCTKTVKTEPCSACGKLGHWSNNAACPARR
jgi:hypothetical protein